MGEEHVSQFVLPDFDKWCRVSGGLTNAKLAAALSVDGRKFSADDVDSWRLGGPLDDPSTILKPLQMALMRPWPPETAEKAWQELLAVIAGAIPASEAPPPRVLNPLIPVRSTPLRPAKAAVPDFDPEVEAVKTDINSGVERLAKAVQASEQVAGGWLARTTDKFKKYVTSRDFKHRKAFLQATLERAESTLEKNRARRDELAGAITALGTALATFDAMQKQNTERMERKRDENVNQWREIKLALPLVAQSRVTHDKAKSKSLPAIEELVKRSQTAVTDWKTKFDSISEAPQVTLAWLTPTSKVGARLKQIWDAKACGGEWPEGFDPFEDAVICRDKLADNYKVGVNHAGEKPVEIDLAAEIDLGIVDLETRRSAAKAVAEKA